MEADLERILAETEADIIRLDAEIAGPERIYVGNGMWSVYTFDEKGAQKKHAMVEGNPPPPADPDMTPPRTSVTVYLDAYRWEHKVTEFEKYGEIAEGLLFDMTEAGMMAIRARERFSDITKDLPQDPRELDSMGASRVQSIVKAAISEMPGKGTDGELFFGLLGKVLGANFKLPPVTENEPGESYWSRVQRKIMMDYQHHTKIVVELAKVHGKAHEAMVRAAILNEKRKRVIAEESYVSCQVISQGEFPSDAINWDIYESLRPKYEEIWGERQD